MLTFVALVAGLFFAGSIRCTSHGAGLLVLLLVAGAVFVFLTGCGAAALLCALLCRQATVKHNNITVALVMLKNVFGCFIQLRLVVNY